MLFDDWSPYPLQLKHRYLSIEPANNIQKQVAKFHCRLFRSLFEPDFWNNPEVFPAENKLTLGFVRSKTKAPDVLFKLSQLADLRGDRSMQKQWANEFASIVTDPAYGNMYNKYLITIYTTNKNDLNKALTIAEKEVESRPTPETFDWLAWVYYKKGDITKAYELIKNNVIGKTFEPNSLLRTAYILKSHGERRKSNKIFKECLTSSFELGPITTAEIKNQLN